MLSACLFVFGIAAPQAQTPSELLRARVEQLHEEGGRSVRGVRLLEPDAVSHLFQKRNFTPAWQGGGPDQILQAIRGVEQDGLDPRNYHLAAIESLRAAPADSPGRDADLQILLTDAVAALVNDVRFGKVRPSTLDRRWNMDPRAGAPPLEAFLADIAAAPSPAAAIDALKSSHFIYRGLKQALAAQRAIASGGGWPAIPAGPALKPGMRNPRIAAVRKRLAATGELATASDSEEYDDALALAVKQFQERHRLAPDGSIGKATLDAMNVTAAARIDQIRVNLERARWVLRDLSDTFVLVNLPEALATPRADVHFFALDARWGFTLHERLALVRAADAYIGAPDELASAALISGRAALISLKPTAAEVTDFLARCFDATPARPARSSTSPGS